MSVDYSYCAPLGGQKVLIEVAEWTHQRTKSHHKYPKTNVSFLFFLVAVKYIVP